jgi:hypothetical protein
MMRSSEAQGLVRQLITEADHLSRTSYAAAREERSWRFAALRSTLQRLERGLGQEPPRFALRGELDLVYQRVVAMASSGAPEEEAELKRMVQEAHSLRTRAFAEGSG